MQIYSTTNCFKLGHISLVLFSSYESAAGHSLDDLVLLLLDGLLDDDLVVQQLLDVPLQLLLLVQHLVAALLQSGM